jgi:hypothetical protein
VKRTLSLLAAGVLAAGGFAVLVSSPAAGSTTPRAVNGSAISKHLRAAVAALPVAAPRPGGYVRSKFKLWDDADHDCGRSFTNASGLDIDHLVPLEEAWASGARSWSPSQREAYANDLTEVRTLVAVSAHANRSKGDQDPAHWLPDEHRCRYVNQWVVVKLRWSLTVDKAEKAALARVAAGCPDLLLTTHRAKVVGTSTSHGGSGGSGGGHGGSGGLDPRFDTCTEAKAHGYGPYRRGHDPEYYWYEDRDGDGIVCE